VRSMAAPVVRNDRRDAARLDVSSLEGSLFLHRHCVYHELKIFSMRHTGPDFFQLDPGRAAGAESVCGHVRI
jgi:hypothetical protein